MRFSTTVFVLSLLAFSLSCLAQAPPQQDKTNKPKKKRQKPPVMRPIEDVEGLPRVLLIGDSISIGYTLPVRELMQGVANVHRPLTNCGPTTEGLQHIDQWLGKEKWDVIHFNWGLHDLKYMGPSSDRSV
jgi:acyl-CoA thioesterase-1